MDEKTAVLDKESTGHFSVKHDRKDDWSTRDISHGGGCVTMERTMGLPSSILLMINICCGSGIFVSPAVGVAASVGSVGLSMIIWVVCGHYNIVLVLCYAEIGTAIPRAGGDYTDLEVILGSLPAFLSLWL